MATQIRKIDKCDPSVGAWLSAQGFNASDFQGAPLTITVTDAGPSRAKARPAPAKQKVAAKKTAGKTKGRTAVKKTAKASSAGARKTKKR